MGGPFLKAIEELRKTIRDLKSEVAGVENKIAGLADAYKNNIKLRLQARLKIQEALEQKKVAEEQEKEAADLLAKEQDSNVERLRAIADAALKEYKAALKAFDDVFIAGTKLDLLQKKEETNLLRGGSKLKTIKQVL